MIGDNNEVAMHIVSKANNMLNGVAEKLLDLDKIATEKVALEAILVLLLDHAPSKTIQVTKDELKGIVLARKRIRLEEQEAGLLVKIIQE